jgi:amino acid transporter
MNDDEGLKREIGLWGLVANSINIIIGAGIFILPVVVADKLGPVSYWAYLICGFLMILIMLCFAEVGTIITRTGGAYSYIETAFGRYTGFLTTNIFVFGAAIMANAAVANGLLDTLAYFIPFFKAQLARIAFFLILFTGLAFFNIRGVRQAIIIVKLNTIAKLVPLLMIALFGWLFFINPVNTSVNTLSFNTIGEISLILLFAFVGAETALNVSGEIKNPEKTIPRGIMLSMSIVVVLYILIQVSVQGILGSSITDYSNAPLAEVGRRMFGQAGATAMLSSASYLIIYLGVILAMTRFRMRNSFKKASYKVPGGFLIPLISIFTIIWLLSNLPVKELFSMVLFIILLTIAYLALKFAKVRWG